MATSVDRLPQSAPLPRPTLTRSASKRTSHYRTFSSCQLDVPDDVPSPRRRRLTRPRPSSSFYPEMGNDKTIRPSILPLPPDDQKPGLMRALKKKGSFASLLSDSTIKQENVAHAIISRPYPLRSSTAPVRSSSDRSSSEGESDVDETVKTPEPAEFAAKRLVTQNGMLVHPHSTEAPYPQSYGDMSLENDRYTDILLRRLIPHGTPSFCKYDTPPKRILDLGCGPGYWIKWAAQTWRHSTFTGFDMVDLMEEETQAMDNVNLLLGNFTEHTLPFQDETFDHVRMANLYLCIPYTSWSFVLGEVYRILKVGGRVEIIDDKFTFPYGDDPQSIRISPSKPDDPSLFNLESDDSDTDTTESSDESFHSSTSTLTSEPGTVATTPEEDSPLSMRSDRTESCLPTPATAQTLRIPRTPPPTWAENAVNARSIETLYSRYLKYHLRIVIDEDPYTDLLHQVFGKPNTGKLHTFHLKLAPSDPKAIHGYEHEEKLTRTEKVRNAFRWKKDLPSTPEEPLDVDVPGTLSTKAATKLGINFTTLAEATAAATGNRSPTRPPHTLRPAKSSSSLLDLASTQSLRLSVVSAKSPKARSFHVSKTTRQSLGLIVWPSTFIPMNPMELEMHACKHMHTLLSCRSGLLNFVASIMDGGEYPRPVMSRAVFKEALWRYECFRRSRFNWPQVPDLDMSSESDDHPHSPFEHKKSSSWSKLAEATTGEPRYGIKELVHVRSIRVFEGIKAPANAL